MRATTYTGRVVHDFKINVLNPEYATSICGSVYARKLLARRKPDEPVTCRKCNISIAKIEAAKMTLLG